MVLLNITATISIDLRNAKILELNMTSLIDTDLKTAKMLCKYISKDIFGDYRIFDSGTVLEYTFNTTITSDPIIIENVKKFFSMDQEYHSSTDLIFEVLLKKEYNDYYRYIGELGDDTIMFERYEGLYRELYNEYHLCRYNQVQRNNNIKLPKIENKLNNIYALLTFKSFFGENYLDKNLKYIIAEYLDYNEYKDELFGEGSKWSLI